MKKWTKKEVPDLSGKVIIVTGGNSGLGFESVKLFTEKGADVVMACRSLARGEAARAKLARPENVEVMLLDLLDFDSIRSFAVAFKQKYQRLDVLMNNAGVMMRPYELAACGVESQLASNHLGHFLLTHSLLDYIAQTKGSRVVSLSSLAHKKGVFELNNINYDEGKSYDPMTAYRRSKLANLLFAIKLQDYFESRGIEALSLIAHPGVVPTNLVNHTIAPLWRPLLRPLAQLFLQSPRQGALPQVRAAVGSGVKGGDFFGPSSKKEWRGSPVRVEAEARVCRAKWADDLWAFSEKICGCKY